MSDHFVLSANDLLTGDVVYLDETAGWCRLHNEAKLFGPESDAGSLLEWGRSQPDIVDLEIHPATMGPSGPEPVHFRDRFRAKGPSNYPHGKQELASYVPV